jgi:hypothetical protein
MLLLISLSRKDVARIKASAHPVSAEQRRYESRRARGERMDAAFWDA